ncbi:retrotransposon protein, putative, ty1-copia subclass [Tanacetum coccineum]
MIKDLKAVFEKQAGVERFDLIQTFHACKQEEGKPIAAYVIHMKGYVDQLERFGYVLPQDLIVGLILNGLAKDFSSFAETPQVMMIKGGKIQKANKKSLKVKGKGKANGKGKDKQVYIPKPKNPKPSAKEHPAKDDACHHCKEVGHWKRNCLVYLAELLKKKKQVGSASSSGIFTIELFAFPNKSWVYDTGCGTNICITKQGFREARKLKQGALYLYVGNGVRAQVEAIGSFDLVLPNGLVICLDNCHYAHSITRGVVSVHRLVENGFDYALESATRILNMVLTKNVDKTPYELWYGKVPNLSYINVWGCEALVKRDTPDKLQQRSVKCIFIGYPKETIDASFSKIEASKNKIVVARYVEFFEKNLITQEVSRRAIDLEEIQDEDTSPSEITSEIPMEVEGSEPPQEEDIPIRRMDNSKCGHIPMQEILDLNKTQCALTPKEVKRMQNVPYALALGSIMYAVRCTRPDVAFSQNITSRFQQNPGELHWTAVKNILKFEIDRDDTKSQIGYVFILNGDTVDWKSSKQSTTAMSATEAEYIAASETAMEAVWIRKFISKLGIEFREAPDTTIGEIRFLKVHTDDNLVDPFTKALPKGKLTQHARSMGLRLASSFM